MTEIIFSSVTVMHHYSVFTSAVQSRHLLQKTLHVSTTNTITHLSLASRDRGTSFQCSYYHTSLPLVQFNHVSYYRGLYMFPPATHITHYLSKTFTLWHHVTKINVSSTVAITWHYFVFTSAIQSYLLLPKTTHLHQQHKYTSLATCPKHLLWHHVTKTDVFSM